MPTRTMPVRRTQTHARGGGAGRFARRSQPAPRSAGRFARPMSVQRPAVRGRRKAAPQGMLAKAMSALPMMSTRKVKGRRGRKGRSSKAPMMGVLMAGAGALLGRRRMQQRRRAADTPDMSTGV